MKNQNESSFGKFLNICYSGTKDHGHAVDRLAEEFKGKYRIKREKPLIVPLRYL